MASAVSGLGTPALHGAAPYRLEWALNPVEAGEDLLAPRHCEEVARADCDAVALGGPVGQWDPNNWPQLYSLASCCGGGPLLVPLPGVEAAGRCLPGLAESRHKLGLELCFGDRARDAANRTAAAPWRAEAAPR